MIRFLHLADLHLGAEPSLLGGMAAQRGQDFLNGFERAVDYAVDPGNEIHAILIAGDFFDAHNPSKETVRFAVRHLKRLQRAKVPVILTPGNHDALGYPDSVYMDHSTGIHKLTHLVDCPNVERVTSLSLNGDPVHFYGMAWNIYRSAPPFDRFRADLVEGFHIAVLHGTLDNAQYFEAHSRDVPLARSNLANSGMDYIALGHIHSSQQHKAGDVPVVYPGTLEGRRFIAGEEGERNLLVVELVKGKPAKFEYIPWNRRVLQRERLDFDTEVIETEDELVALIIDRYADPDKLLRLHLTGTALFVIDLDRLENRVSGDFFWVELRDKTEVFNSALVEAWENEETIRGLFIRKMKTKLVAATCEEERKMTELALKLVVQSFSKTIRRGR